MQPEVEPSEGSMTVRDGRTVAWTDWGPPDGRPLLRFPGTPGSRWGIRADRTPWAERGLRVVTTERPGFGASTRLPGRSFRDHVDDVAEVLDHLGLDQVHLYGGSGAAAYELALCQYHSDRVAAATIIAGGTPMTADEAATVIPLNHEVWQHVQAGRRDEVVAILAPLRDEILADPLGAFGGIMGTAPPPWELDPAAILTSIVWYHAVEDRNCPFSAAQRLVAELPDARFVEWRDAGHFTAYHLEREILDELFARG